MKTTLAILCIALLLIVGCSGQDQDPAQPQEMPMQEQQTAPEIDQEVHIIPSQQVEQVEQIIADTPEEWLEEVDVISEMMRELEESEQYQE